jgi:hypothetical protein
VTAPIGTVRRDPAGVVAVKRGDWRMSWRGSDGYDRDDDDVADWTTLVPAVPMPDHTVRRVARELFNWNAADLAHPRFVLHDVGMTAVDVDPYDALVRKVLELANLPVPPEDEPCSCNGGWVEDQNFQPEDYERHDPLTPGKGLIPCGSCNHGGWDADWTPGLVALPSDGIERGFDGQPIDPEDARCSNPPAMSCADAGCPEHSDQTDPAEETSC